MRLRSRPIVALAFIVGLTALSALTGESLQSGPTARWSPPVRTRVSGLVIGSLIGDALGGPYEFQDELIRQFRRRLRSPWKPSEVDSFPELIRYSRAADPYAAWTSPAPAGTVTDDSRMKIILLQTLRAHSNPTKQDIAATLVQFFRKGGRWKKWLEEYGPAAQYVASNGGSGRPLDRLWGGIPNVSGQMMLLPLAGLFVDQPGAAYARTWSLDPLDIGQGKDITSAVIAGLASALGSSGSVEQSLRTMRSTDPYGFAAVPWVRRRVNWAIDESRAMVKDWNARTAAGQPPSLEAQYQQLFKASETRVHWEAWVPLMVSTTALLWNKDSPNAAFHWVIGYGHDVDSNLQLLGAWVGALKGESFFPRVARTQVKARLAADYGEDFDQWMTTLERFVPINR
jgi:hypothetical protein